MYHPGVTYNQYHIIVKGGKTWSDLSLTVTVALRLFPAPHGNESKRCQSISVYIVVRYLEVRRFANCKRNLVLFVFMTCLSDAFNPNTFLLQCRSEVAYLVGNELYMKRSSLSLTNRILQGILSKQMQFGYGQWFISDCLGIIKW